MLQTLIQNAIVIDGTGLPGRRMDVGIKDGKLVLDPGSCEAAEILDAEGFVLAPGFIDVHGHSDLAAHLDPLCAGKLCQGVTTEIAGQCGISPAPLVPENMGAYIGYYQNMGAPLYPGYEAFTSIGAFMDALDSLHMGINIALFAAHGSLRLGAMGFDFSPANAKQLDTMAALAREAMNDGALGVSSGLMYAPGIFASPEELTAVCRGAAEKNGIYTSHIRNQGNRLLESVEETLTVARNAGITANISHNKAVGKANWGKVRETIRMIHEDGTATHDVYPYTASSTVLSATLPPSCVKMGNDKLIAALNDPAFREELAEKIFHPTEEWDNDLLECGYDGILIIAAAKTTDAVGKTIAECAKMWDIAPFDAYCRLLADNAMTVSDICFSMSEDDVAEFVRDPLCMIGSDGTYIAGLTPMTHPRSMATFPRIFRKYVREQKLISMEEAVRKMTGFPAQRYGLRGKGMIKDGFDADLVLFNPNTIADQATYVDPFLKNIGIERVYVNGTLAVLNGEATGARGGKVFRR